MADWHQDSGRSATPSTGGEEATWIVSQLQGTRPYRVGEPYRPGQPPPHDGALLTLDRLGYSLVIVQSALVDSQIETIRQATMELALIVEDPLVVLAYRFGTDVPWESVPYAWPLATAAARNRVLPPARTGVDARALLWITLVDSDTGLIAAQRGIVLEPGFTAALNESIRKQVRTAFDGNAYVSAISRVYINHPDVTTLVAQRALIRTSSAH